jgi:hypothetical protein
MIDFEMTSEQADEELIKRLEWLLARVREGQVHQALIIVELESVVTRVSSMLCGNEEHVVRFLDRVFDATEKLMEIELNDTPAEAVKLNG